MANIILAGRFVFLLCMGLWQDEKTCNLASRPELHLYRRTCYHYLHEKQPCTLFWSFHCRRRCSRLCAWSPCLCRLPSLTIIRSSWWKLGFRAPTIWGVILNALSKLLLSLLRVELAVSWRRLSSAKRITQSLYSYSLHVKLTLDPLI